MDYLFSTYSLRFYSLSLVVSISWATTTKIKPSFLCESSSSLPFSLLREWIFVLSSKHRLTGHLVIPKDTIPHTMAHRRRGVGVGRSGASK